MPSLPYRFEPVVRRCLWEMRAFLGLIPSLKTQSLNAVYEVTLHNVSDVQKIIDVVLPCPRERSYQKILKPTLYTPVPSSLQTEQDFGNTYAHWNISLAPNETKIIRQTSLLEIYPRLHPSEPETPDEELRLASVSRPHIDGSHSEIQKIAKQLQAEAGTCACVLVEAINRYVATNLTYGNPIPGLYSAEEAVTKSVVDCGGFSTLFIALCHACKIPARLVSGFWTNSTHQSMHAWCEAFLPGEGWVAVDPDVEQMRNAGRSSRVGSLGKVGSDRVVYSLGCDLTLEINGKTHLIDILQTPYLVQEDPEIKMNYSFTTNNI